MENVSKQQKALANFRQHFNTISAISGLSRSILVRTLVVATSAAIGESEHAFSAWLQKNVVCEHSSF